MYAMQYHAATRKGREMLSAATWMDLEGIMQRETRQADKAKYRMISFVREI